MGRTLLLDEAVPLLTLTGPGGVGKTRLALAVASYIADRFADGVIWVDLAPLTDASLVGDVAARASGLVPPPDQPADEMVIRHLRSRQTLLLLDNCEHLMIGAAQFVARLLVACPAIQVLATSRAPLRLRSEHELSVDPLPLPNPTGETSEEIATNVAVQLFVERARAAGAKHVSDGATLTDVVEICRRLDGLPLAIELAAGRTRVMSVPALRDRLQRHLPLLEGGPRDAPARQQTIRDTIAWSYDLLNQVEQAFFARLAVFAGGFNLEAAGAVAGEGREEEALALLDRLVELHLIRPMPNAGDARFTMLETIREFALDRLRENGAEAQTRNRHAAHFSEFVTSLQTWVASYLPQSQHILSTLEIEYPNLQAALSWYREAGAVGSLLQLGGELFFFWQLRSRLREGRAWLEWGLAQDVAVPDSARAMGQLGLSGILFVQNELERAMTLGEASLRHYRDSGDVAEMARAGDHAAAIALSAGDGAACRAYIAESLAALSTIGAAPWARRATSHVRHYRGCLDWCQEDLDRAEELLRAVVEEQAAIAREEGAEHAYACWPLLALGGVVRARGAVNEALGCLQESLRHARRVQELRCTVDALVRIAEILASVRRTAEAAWLFGAAEAFCERSGLGFMNDIWTWDWVRDPELAQQWRGQSESLTAMGERVPPIPSPTRDAVVAENWAAGRATPIAQAITFALGIDLSAASPKVPIEVAATARPANFDDKLTQREREVLTLLCERYTDPEIAARLFISPRTAEGHVAHIIAKLGVENRRDAAAVAARMGYV